MFAQANEPAHVLPFFPNADLRFPLLSSYISILPELTSAVLSRVTQSRPQF